MPNGVEQRGKTLRVYFRYENEMCREKLPLENSPKNVEYAERMVEQIKHEISAGTFDYARYFPNSTRLQENTLAHYLGLFLTVKKPRIAAETHRGYARLARNQIQPYLGSKQMDQIDQIQVEQWISEDLAHLASSTIRDALSVLSQTYDLYRTRHRQAHNPTDGVKIELPDDEDPDPFTRDEIDKILATTPRESRLQELALIQFMLWSGPRVSEAIALSWEDVDLEKGVVYFRRARVRGAFKSTKTKRSTRVHELIAPARSALEAQFNRTGQLPRQSVDVTQRDNRTVKQEKLRFVFLNTHTGEPHYSDFTLRDRFFKAHLKRAGVRYRGPNNGRHTYISQMLTAGMPLEWISKQTGTSVEMIRRRYGKWIDADAEDMARRAEKLLGL